MESATISVLPTNLSERPSAGGVSLYPSSDPAMESVQPFPCCPPTSPSDAPPLGGAPQHLAEDDEHLGDHLAQDEMDKNVSLTRTTNLRAKKCFLYSQYPSSDPAMESAQPFPCCQSDAPRVVGAHRSILPMTICRVKIILK